MVNIDILLLPLILSPECYHLLGNVEQCKDYFKQAYYVYKAIGDEHSANDMASEAHEYFGSDFQL